MYVYPTLKSISFHMDTSRLYVSPVLAFSTCRYTLPIYHPVHCLFIEFVCGFPIFRVCFLDVHMVQLHCISEGVGILAAGQSSTMTGTYAGTYAGQFAMEVGLFNFQLFHRRMNFGALSES